MNDSPKENSAVIAGLLNKLADLSGDEAALEAYRREADEFDPPASTVGILIALLALETDAASRKETLAHLEDLTDRRL